MIIFDTETTGFPKNQLIPIEDQPEVIEFAAVKLNDETLLETDHICFRCKPSGKIEKQAEKVHGISNEDLQSEEPFHHYLPKVKKLFLGETYLIAHNCAFDSKLLSLELLRLEATNRFPWPPIHLCTVEASRYIKGVRMNLAALYEHYCGKELKNAHAALADVRALAECVREMIKKGDLII